MEINNFFENLQKDMDSSRGDQFTIDFERTLWGSIQSALLLSLTIPMMFHMYSNMFSWWEAVVFCYLLFWVIDSIKTLFGCLAYHLAFRKTAMKKKVVGV